MFPADFINGEGFVPFFLLSLLFIAAYCSILGSILEKINPEGTLSQLCHVYNTENYFLEPQLTETKHHGNGPFVLSRQCLEIRTIKSEKSLCLSSLHSNVFFLGLTINLITILSVLGFPADFLWSLCAVASRRPQITSRPNKLKVICGSEYPISEPECSGPIRAAGSWLEVGRGRRPLGPLGRFSLTPVTSVFNTWKVATKASSPRSHTSLHLGWISPTSL